MLRTSWRRLGVIGQLQSLNINVQPYEYIRDSLHTSVYLGMQDLSKYTDTQCIDTHTHTLKARLVEFANGVQPHDIIKVEMQKLNIDLPAHIATKFTEISDIAKYLFETQGKKLRPLLNLLINRTLMDCFPNQYNHDISIEETQKMQTQMTQVAELIHIASMLHDDVVDNAVTRRGRPSAHGVFGNKKTVLGGDFLLARACQLVASFGIPEVFQRTARIVESLVMGELIQPQKCVGDIDAMIRSYLTKTYHKTAALMAESSACGAILAGLDQVHCNLAFELGSAFGMAFQIYDDLLDYTATSAGLGKPVLNDISCGVITSPVLLASYEFPEETLRLIQNLQTQTEKESAMNLVLKSSSLARTRLLVFMYATHMLDLLQALPHPPTHEGPSVYARGLTSLLMSALTRVSDFNH